MIKDFNHSSRRLAERCLRRWVGGFCLALLIPALTGCIAVGIHEQGLVSKPNMLFSESAAFQYDCPTLSQLEPGLAFSGGAQATTCTACQ